VRQAACVLAMIVALGWAAPTLAQRAPDEQSLKVAHDTVMSAVKSANLTVLQALIHPRALGFYRDSQFPVEIRSDYTAADALPSVLTDLSRFVSVPTSSVYRVVGQVGVVCMTASLQMKKGSKDRYSRGTYVYISEGGNWKLLSWHGSDTPLKQ
jgi:hypothetical protein